MHGTIKKRTNTLEKIMNGGWIDIVVVRGSYTMFLSIYCVSEVKSHTHIL